MNFKVFNVYYSVRNVIFFLGEIVLIFFSILTVSYVKISILDADLFFWESVLPKIFLITFVCIFCLYYSDMYNFNKTFDFSSLITKLIQSLGIACIVLAFIYFISPNLVISEKIFIFSLIFIIIFIPSWRILYNYLIKSKKLTKRIMFMGLNNIAKKIIAELNNRNDFSFDMIGYVGDKDTDNALSYLGTENKLKEAVQDKSPDILIVALKERRGKLPLKLLVDLKLNGLIIQDATKFYESLTGRLIVEEMTPSYIIFNEGFSARPFKKRIKRLLDIVLALLGLIISLPILIITAMAIKLESRGPVIYKQQRVGEKKKVFTIYKLRSMKNSAEKGKPTWAKENDSRVTKVGKFIRKTRLDEIPQMWNVLKGDMSFVGPRPERPYFVDKLTDQIPYYTQRHVVKPGITGWAQIRYPYGASVEDALEKLKYDLYYIKNFSILFDLAILFETTKVVLLKTGGR